MADKEVLIEIKVDNAQAQKSITEQSRKIDLLKKNNDKLKQTNKELAEQGNVTAAQRAKNSAEIAKNSLKIQEANKVRRTAIQSQKAEAGSLNALRSRLSKLTAERNKNLTVGSASFNKANTEIKTLTQSIKSAEQGGDDFRRSVGKYPSSFNAVGDSVSKISPALGGMIQGFVGMTKAALAFIATPIGLILAGIALALKAVISFFQRTEDGGNKLAVGMAFLSGAFEAVMDVVGGLGKLLFDVFVSGFNIIANQFKINGLVMKEVILGLNVAYQKVFGSVEDYDKAQKELSDNTNEIIKLGKEQIQIVNETTDSLIENTKEIVKNTAATEEKIRRTTALKIKQQELRKEVREDVVLEAQRRQDIQKDLLITRDFTKSFEERQAALLRANKLEQESLKAKLELGKKEIEQAREADDINQSDADALDALAAAEAKFIQIKTDSLKRQRELTNRVTEQQNRERAEQKRISDEEDKKAKDEEKRLNDKLTRETQNANDLEVLRLQKDLVEIEGTQAKADKEIEILDLKHEQEVESLKEKLATENELTLSQLNEQLSNGVLQFASLEELEFNHAQQVIKINKDASNEVKSNDDKLQKDIIANDKKTTQIRKQNAQGYLSALGSIFNTAGQLAGDNFKLQKAFGIAEAVVNTARGVTQALGSAPPPLSFVTAGAVAVAGAAQIATIAKSQPSGGDTSVPIPSQGGLTEPTADTSGVDSQASQQEALQNAIASLNLQVSVSEITDTQNAVAVSEQNSTIGG